MGRVTDSMMYGKGEQSISRAREKMVKNQEQAVTGRAVNRPSDNPVSAMKVIGLKAREERDNQLSYNLDTASSILTMTDSALSELTDLLSRAKELSIQMSSTSNFTDDTRAATANEIEQLMYRAIQIGNSRVGDRYIFGGYQTDRAPFDTDGNYFGDAGVIEIEMDQGQRMGINVTGMDAFFGRKDIQPTEQQIRDDSMQMQKPTIDGGLRAPASASAAAQEKIVQAEVEKDENGVKAKAPVAMREEKGINIFLAFKNLTEGLKQADIRTVQSSIDDFDESYKQVLSLRALVGSRQNLVTASQNGIDRSKINNAELVSQAQDADTYKSFSDLAKNEHTLNATLETNKRLLTPSLLDFLK